MNSFRGTNFKTTTHFVYTVLVFLTGASTAQIAWGQAGSLVTVDPMTQLRQDCAKPEYRSAYNYKDADDCLKRSRSDMDSRSTDRCDAEAEKLNDSIKDIQKVCVTMATESVNSASGDPEAQVPRPDKNCLNRFKKCFSNSPAPVDTTQAFANVLGMSQGQLKENCVQSPKSYYAKHKDLKTRIETLDKDIQTQEEAVTTADEKHKDTLVRLQEKLADQQKKFDELKDKMDADKLREQQSAFEDDQKKAAQAVDLQAKSMDLRAKLRSTNTKAQADLLLASDSMANSECMAQVQQYKDQHIKAIRAQGAGTLVTQGNAFKDTLNQKFQTCVKAMDLKRQDIAESLRESVASISTQMDAVNLAQQQLDAAKQQNASAQATRLAKMDEQTQKAIKDATQQTQQLQAQAKDESTLLQQKKATIGKRLQSLNNEKNLANADLITLGRPSDDSDSSSDKSEKDLVEASNSSVVKMQTFARGKCCTNKPNEGMCQTARLWGGLPNISIPRSRSSGGNR